MNNLVKLSRSSMTRHLFTFGGPVQACLAVWEAWYMCSTSVSLPLDWFWISLCRHSWRQNCGLTPNLDVNSLDCVRSEQPLYSMWICDKKCHSEPLNLSLLCGAWACDGLGHPPMYLHTRDNHTGGSKEQGSVLSELIMLCSYCEQTIHSPLGNTDYLFASYTLDMLQSH